MIFWLALVVFGIPLVYMLAQHGESKRRRQRELERIQKRLAEIEGTAAGTPEED